MIATIARLGDRMLRRFVPAANARAAKGYCVCLDACFVCPTPNFDPTTCVVASGYPCQ